MPGYRWHPAIVHFPVACWVLATLLDVGRLLGIEAIRDWTEAAPMLLTVGLGAAAAAVAAGLYDYARLPRPMQESKALMRHIVCMGSASTLFLAAALWRFRLESFEAPAALYVTGLEVVGSALLVAGGHFAAIVVYGEPSSRM